MATRSQVATDNFNRAGPGLGSNWTQYSSPAPEIDSNEIIAGSSSTGGTSGWTNDSFADDQYSSIEVTDDTGSNHYVGVSVRCSDAAGDGDFYECDTDGTGDSGMYRCDNGEYDQLQEFSSHPGIGDDYSLEIVDDDLQAYINESTLGTSETDATYSSGDAGVWAGWGTSPNGDNWEAGDMVTDTTVTPGVCQMTMTGYPPTVTATEHVSVTPGVCQVTMNGHPPTVTVTEHVTVTPGVCDITMTGYPPTVSVTDHKVVEPGVCDVAMTGYPPTVTVSDHKLVRPGVCDITMTGYPPIVTTTNHIGVYPGVCNIIMVAYPPIVSVDFVPYDSARYWRLGMKQGKV